MKVSRDSVESHPILICRAMHPAVNTGEEHIQLRIQLYLRLIIALHIIVTPSFGQFRIVSKFALIEETIFRTGLGAFHSFRIHRFAGIDDRVIHRLLYDYGNAILGICHRIREDRYKFFLLTRI